MTIVMFHPMVRRKFLQHQNQAQTARSGRMWPRVFDSFLRRHYRRALSKSMSPSFYQLTGGAALWSSGGVNETAFRQGTTTNKIMKTKTLLLAALVGVAAASAQAGSVGTSPSGCPCPCSARHPSCARRQWCMPRLARRPRRRWWWRRFRPVPARIMSGSAGIGRIGRPAMSGCMAAGTVAPPVPCANIITAAATAVIGGKAGSQSRPPPKAAAFLHEST